MSKSDRKAPLPRPDPNSKRLELAPSFSWGEGQEDGGPFSTPAVCHALTIMNSREHQISPMNTFPKACPSILGAVSSDSRCSSISCVNPASVPSALFRGHMGSEVWDTFSFFQNCPVGIQLVPTRDLGHCPKLTPAFGALPAPTLRPRHRCCELR